jgi:hypothetical protein
MTESDLVAVHIVGAPVGLWAKAQEHSDELFREFMLIASARERDGVDHDVPRRLTLLIEELTTRYGGFSEAQEQQLADAAAAGEPTIDLVYQIPPGAVEAARHLGELMDEADDYCRAGEHLLTLATPKPQVDFRRWYLAEFIRQGSGEPPMSWPEYERTGR